MSVTEWAGDGGSAVGVPAINPLLAAGEGEVPLPPAAARSCWARWWCSA
jgi:hypothetical protein